MMRTILACSLSSALVCGCGPGLPECGSPESVNNAIAVIGKIVDEKIATVAPQSRRPASMPPSSMELVTLEGKDDAIKKVTCQGTYKQKLPDAFIARVKAKGADAEAGVTGAMALLGPGPAKVSLSGVETEVQWTMQPANGSQFVTKLELPEHTIAALAMVYGVVNAVDEAAKSQAAPNAPQTLSSAPAKKTYRGTGDGDLLLELKNQEDNQVAISMNTSLPGGCAGSLEGIGQRDGSIIRLTAKAPGSDDVCTFRVELSSDEQLATSEESGCTLFHGASCGFGGRLTLVH